ncbi:4'-phosphopantetheinyl transferase superfamily protein [Mycoplasma sp. 744]|uniref:4'-phosphopantetheinyl transferase superfamily protein n=1 Tax=unclassified Mycoplasma TaxID=2683645 RepID=UPI00211CB67E|nr:MULTISPECIES: 4'-phosphopantetheinyl transferase superfamily protein [unclassified Mycoplasma]MEA4115309.1 4'-phosphopantetheinyl transferase superfamily protein [Mycoplasma sp. 744]UUM19311.1 4'-phosphopantetheinyl transferase superfamily protein [Mycoplasma sp. 1018B]
MNIGVDLVDIERFKNKEFNFFKRFLHKNEINFIQMQTSADIKIIYVASIWAIKEAIFKANNTYSQFNKIEIKRKNNHWWHENFSISISHEKNLIVAFVVEKKEI